MRLVLILSLLLTHQVALALFGGGYRSEFELPLKADGFTFESMGLEIVSAVRVDIYDSRRDARPRSSHVVVTLRNTRHSRAILPYNPFDFLYASGRTGSALSCRPADADDSPLGELNRNVIEGLAERRYILKPTGSQRVIDVGFR